MREILFRGKSTLYKDIWYQGYYRVSSWGTANIETGTGVHDVITETVGQFTGHCDKNGEKIFEGDILSRGECFHNGVIYWDGGGFAMLQAGKRVEIGFKTNAFKWQDVSKMQIIGNIHSNPELLEAQNG